MKERGVAAFALVLVIAGGLWLQLGAQTRASDGSVSADAPSWEAPRRPPPATKPAGPDELALLAPLEAGGTLADWNLQFIGSIHGGRLPLLLEREGVKIRLDVVLASEDAPEPPAKTRRFHVYYRATQPAQEDAQKLARALAEVVAKNGSVAPPPGMATYHDAGRDPWAGGI